MAGRDKLIGSGVFMPGQRTRANRGIKLFCFVVLALSALFSPFLEAFGENEEGASETVEGRIWIPRLAFPPRNPSAEAGYLPLLKRDISVEYLKYTFYLSLAKGLEVTKRDSDFYLRVHGRIYLDYVYYFEDKNNLGPDGFGLTTIQLDADGRFSERWLYRLSIGGMTSGGKFDGGQGYVDDAYVTHVGEKTAWIFGQQDEPISLEHLESSLATPFMMRALPDALTPGKNLGVAFSTIGNQWSLIAGLFGGNLPNAKDQGNEGMGFTGRFVFQPENGAQDKVIHLGGSISYRGVTGSQACYFRYRPESALTNVRYVNTGDIDGVERIKQLGLEAAFQSGPLSFQVEYLATALDRDSGYDNLRFSGWYAYVSWFLTGGSRRYFPKEAIFGYPEIRSKWGALEFAARYSMVDLNSGTIPGGQERNVTLGLNWYINRHFRVMAEYLWIFCDQTANDDGTVVGGDRPRIFQMRFQMFF
jgi:phosphate-selective porin OprO/OprP